MDLEKTKLSLLSHSKNLVIASDNEDWELYSVLESSWTEMLKKAQEKYGNYLNIIANELISDNQKIQKNIVESQKTILSELEKNSQNTVSIQSYLK